MNAPQHFPPSKVLEIVALSPLILIFVVRLLHAESISCVDSAKDGVTNRMLIIIVDRSLFILLPHFTMHQLKNKLSLKHKTPLSFE
jgi:hypothetical protein